MEARILGLGSYLTCDVRAGIHYTKEVGIDVDVEVDVPDNNLKEKAMSIARVLAFLAALFCLSTNAYALRNDVLVIVNDNSIDSSQVGQYYAQQRDINPANIVHIKVPDQYYITWSQFLSLRDQILRFGICPTIPVNLQPAACSDSSQAIYTANNINVLTSNTSIRYLVTTRGVPTRMTVDFSALDSSSTSVDNYLKFWLARYLTADTTFDSPPSPPQVTAATTLRSAAFADGHGMRIVNPAIDGEFIVGRIDGVDITTAKALIDRAIAAEETGLYGKYYGSTFGNTGGVSQWTNYATNTPIYQSNGDEWRYAFGLFGENRPECSNYKSTSHYFAYPESSTSGKTPNYCVAQFNKGNPNETIPGVSFARQPVATDALAYFGSLDGQTIYGGFGTLQNWRKNDSCQVALCANATDPAACRVASTDPYKELNTDCVGVAAGFIGYNFQSFPVSIYGIWPTGWVTTSVDQTDVPVVDATQGYDNNYSLWFEQPDESANPQCYSYTVTSAGSQTPVSGVLGSGMQPCQAVRKIGLSQVISRATPDSNNPPIYRLSFYLKGQSIPSAGTLSSQYVFVYVQPSSGCPASPPSYTLSIDGTTTCTYYSTVMNATYPAGDSAWTQYNLSDVSPPSVSLTTSEFRLNISGTLASGKLGLDVVSVKDVTTNVNLVTNGSFDQGHQQSSDGDYAANFLSRLGGTAFWGSLSHHGTGGHSFDQTSLGTLVYFLRGLPLGDAVWLGEARGSGLFYGDPLYSPLAVKFDYLPLANDRIVNSAALTGSTVNGRDISKVSTSYQVSYCVGKDFYLCDQAQSWTSTGLSGVGGQSNQALGAWDVSALPYGDYTLRLSVTSTNSILGKSQIFNDYYPIRNRYATAEIPFYAISGKVLDTGGQPVRDVQIQINDNYGFASTVTTDDEGRYSKSGLKNGTYIVSPAKTGYSITANSGNIFQSINGANVTKNFTATGQNYAISGVVRDASGQPVPDAQLQINDNYGFSATTYTNINGYYSRPGISNGMYIVMATKSGYSIAPSVGNIFQSVSGANVTKDFVATSQNYSISGTILSDTGQSVGNVQIQVSDNYGFSATATTNANGYYQVSGLSNGLYTVNPTKSGYGITVNSSNIFQFVNGANVTGKNFTATPIIGTYSISGFVLVNGRPLQGVQVQINDNYGFASTVTTDSAGYYSGSGLKNGTYTVNPVKSGYQFQAVTGNIFQQIQGSNVIGKDYNATQVQ